jgi:uncharacterized protein YkwD
VKYCETCGKRVDLTFNCNYCEGTFCSEHKLPENHKFSKLPNAPPEYIREKIPPTKPSKSYISQPEEECPFEERLVTDRKDQAVSKKRNKRSVYTITAIIFIALLLLLMNPTILSPSGTTPSNTSPTFSPVLLESNPIQTSAYPTQSLLPSNPILQTTPTNTDNQVAQTDFVNYVLTLINSDRQQNGLQNLKLSSVNSGQQHADNMLLNNYFSHWDTQGYKPYMRYTLAGGTGAVAENCAYMWSTGTLTDIKGILKDLEYSMMYDDASSNWGHKENILNVFHNKVSIGVAYDSSHVYLVQDFEDDYIQGLTLTTNDTSIEIRGIILNSDMTISQIGIFYDRTSSLTTSQLSSSTYQDGYDSGTYVGQVLPPPPEGSIYNTPSQGILIVATGWSQTGQLFDLHFSLALAFAQYGKGVYTLCLWTNSNEYLTTYSIWNS